VTRRRPRLNIRRNSPEDVAIRLLAGAQRWRTTWFVIVRPGGWVRLVMRTNLLRVAGPELARLGPYDRNADLSWVVSDLINLQDMTP
jgi:hypothetical protein